MAKSKQQIKFEADVSNFKTNIQKAQNSIKTLNNELKLNQSQLKGNKEDVNLLSQRITTLKEKYEEQSKVVENTRKSYEKAVEIFGENSKEAENLKNKLLQAETAEQNIKNEIDKANKELENQTNKLITISKKWQESGEAIKDFGSKIDSVGNKLSVVSGLVAGIAVASLKASIDFESAFTGVTKTVDGTEEQLAELRKGILDMSTELPSTASEISAVAEAAGQLGIQTDNVLDFTRVMIDLGNSTNVTADEAASALAKFANVTRMSADDYSKLGSTIVALGNNYATTEADIISMGQNLASAGTQVGMSQSDIMALATALSSVGLEAQAGGTAFSKALVSMQLAVETNSKDLKNWADVAGMSTKEFSRLFKEDATSALQAFIKGLSECGGETESAIKVLDDMGITETRMRDALLRSANASDTFSSAIELGSKAWKENTALTNEANKRYGTTESQLTMLKNEVQKTAIEFGDELAPSLRQIVKDAKPMLNSISNAVKAFADLDNKTKKNILTIGAYVVALGPAVKTGGTVIKTIGSATTAVGTLKGALAVLKTGTDNVSDSSKKLASLISAVKSPAGLTTIAITALAGAIIYLNTHLTEEQEEIKKTSEAIKEQRNSYIESQKAREEALQSNISEIDNIQKLRNELSELVDENGNVKDGYKSRAEFILTELNKALGTEYKLNGDIIEQYDELKKSIDEVTAKKRAEIILTSEQEAYKEAIDKIDEYKQTLADLGMTEQEYIDKKNELEETKKTLNSTWEGRLFAKTFGKKEIEALENVVSSYENAKQNITDAYTAIEKYEQDYALFSEGTAESIEQINARIVSSYTDLSNATAEELKEQINVSTTNLNVLKERYAQNQNEITKTYLDAEQKRLSSIAEALLKQTSTVNENSPEVVQAWKDLANNSYSTYYDTLASLDEDLKKKIEEMTGVTAEKTPELVDETKKMMDQVVNEVEQNDEFRKKALGDLTSFLNGLQDSELRELLKQAGVDNIEEVIKGIKEGNLAEDEGIKILDNLNTGLNNTTWKDKLWSTARNIASTLSGLLTVKASVNGTTSTLPGHKDGLDYVPYDNYIARLHKGERVLTAEENKQYMADNIENKISNRNIVVQFYPQSMTETELQRAENYIAKKWGMAL